jgi:hypothetical protein
MLQSCRHVKDTNASHDYQSEVAVRPDARHGRIFLLF